MLVGTSSGGLLSVDLLRGASKGSQNVGGGSRFWEGQAMGCEEYSDDEDEEEEEEDDDEEEE